MDTRRCSFGLLLPRFLEKREEERLTKEYFSIHALEIPFYALVQNIYPIREHQNPIHSLSVLTPTVVS
jgi:hypothetical protein